MRDDRGILVTRVEPGSFAEDIGLREGDVIASINRKPVASVDELKSIQATLSSGDAVAFRFAELAHDLSLDGAPPLFQHLLLKQLLNIHSTLVMGRLGRYEGNLMTWVTPTNRKLIDRATRYVRHLLADAGRPGATYEEVVHRLFAEMQTTPPGESVVRGTFRSLLNGHRPH